MLFSWRIFCHCYPKRLNSSHKQICLEIIYEFCFVRDKVSTTYLEGFRFMLISDANQCSNVLSNSHRLCCNPSSFHISLSKTPPQSLIRLPAHFFNYFYIHDMNHAFFLIFIKTILFSMASFVPMLHILLEKTSIVNLSSTFRVWPMCGRVDLFHLFIKIQGSCE